MLKISELVTDVRTLPCLRKTFILVDERWFQLYVTDARGFLNDCYTGNVLQDGCTDLSEILIEGYEAYEEV